MHIAPLCIHLKFRLLDLRQTNVTQTWHSLSQKIKGISKNKYEDDQTDIKIQHKHFPTLLKGPNASILAQLSLWVQFLLLLCYVWKAKPLNSCHFSSNADGVATDACKH